MEHLREAIDFYTLTERSVPSPFEIQEPIGTDGGYYGVKIRNFGEGMASVCAYARRGDQKKGVYRRKASKQVDEATLRSSLRRSRRTLLMRILELKPDRILTLTYRENKTDLNKAWRDLKPFARNCRAHGIDLMYVVVPERQKRGAIHFHMAIRGFHPVGTLRAAWRNVVDEGNIDVTSPRKGKWNSKKVSGYLMKYLTKEMGITAKDKKRFASSRNIERHEERTLFLYVYIDVLMHCEDLLKWCLDVWDSEWRSYESQDGKLIWVGTY